MNWTEAIDKTIEKWQAIRDSIGTAHAIELLTEINAVCEVCEKASEEAGGNAVMKCRHCLLFYQYGGCQGFGARLSERVAEGNWEEVRALVDQAIGALQAVETRGEETRSVA